MKNTNSRKTDRPKFLTVWKSILSTSTVERRQDCTQIVRALSSYIQTVVNTFDDNHSSQYKNRDWTETWKEKQIHWFLRIQWL